MTTDAPRHSALFTPELLETILLQLPALDVVPAQRVCRQFRDVIRTSVKLQRKVFLLPSGDEEQTWVLVVNKNAGFAVWFEKNVTRWIHHEREKNELEQVKRREIPVRVNPFLMCDPYHFGVDPYHFAVARESAQRAACGSSEVWRFRAGGAIDLRHLDISLARTYVTDPPCRMLKVTLEVLIKAAPRSRYHLTRDVARAEGVTFGDIFSVVMHERGYVSGGHATNYKVHPDKTLHDVLVEYESGRKACIGPKTHISLPGRVVPTKEEWAYMSA